MTAAEVSALGPDRPFPGLRPFSAADYAYFFGRTDQTYALYRMLDRGRFVAVVGSSGSGKSSLVFAGLLPLLDKESREPGGRHWVWRQMTPGGAPLERLIDLVHGLALALGGDSQGDARMAAPQRDRITYLIRLSSRGLVDALAEIEGLKDKTLVLVVDQFEELFRYAASAQRHDRGQEFKWREEAVLFVQLLLTAIRDPECSARIMLTMRSDFIGDCARFHGLPEAVSESQFLVPSLRRDQLEEIIRKPIAKAGAAIDPMLVKRLLTDTGDELDQLPVLQHCLFRLWEQAGRAPIAAVSSGGGSAATQDTARSGRYLTLVHYDQINRMAGALSQHADEILSRDLAGLEPVVAQVFRALSELDREGRATRRAVPLSKIVDETGADKDKVRKIIDRFRADDCSFLRPSPIEKPELSPATAIDIGHEALLRRWEKVSGVPGATGEANDPRPIGWLREEDADARRYQALVSLARDDKAGRMVVPQERVDAWDAHRPSPAWAERYGGDYALVARLIERSRAAIAAEAKRMEAERRARRRAGFLRLAVPVLSLLLLGAVGAVYKINTEKQIAQQHSTLAMKVANDLVGQVLKSLNYGSVSVEAARDMLEPVGAILDQAKDTTTLDYVELKIRLLLSYSDVVMTWGDNSLALERAKQAKTLAEQLEAQDRSNPTFQHFLYGSLFRIGDIVVDRGISKENLEEGLKIYQSAQRIAQRLFDEKPDDGERQFKLAFINDKVGEIRQLQGNFDEAFKQFEAALKIIRITAAKDSAKVEWKAWFPITLTKIGFARFQQSEKQGVRDYKAALDRYSEALARLKKLDDDIPGNSVIMSNLARTHRLIANVLVRQNGPGDYDNAITEYKAAIDISERLRATDPANAQWLVYLAPNYAQLGDALRDHGDVTGALAQYEKELEIRQQLVKKDPSRGVWQRALARCKKKIAALKAAPSPTTGATKKPPTEAPVAQPN
jgi:tetratricopeptide (TPR) repeat protein